ncbi:MAG TPA: hypothetical protein DDW52_24495 [Planctomycetaceae bacterium]|nr:hypothetical protein [Planctomycetaceae bacterium]
MNAKRMTLQRVAFERQPRFRALLVLVLLSAMGAGLRAGDPPPDDASTNATTSVPKILRLRDGSFATGQLRTSTVDGRFSWLVDGMAEPFEFDLKALRGFAPLKFNSVSPSPSASHQFELSDGGSVLGDLKAIDEEWISIESDVLGATRIRREAVTAIVDTSYAGQIVYRGPSVDNRWQSIKSSSRWEHKHGRLVNAKAGGTVVGNIDLPAKSRVRIVLSWEVGMPDFVLSLGTDPSQTNQRADRAAAGARLEVWDREVALVRETQTDEEAGTDGLAEIQMLVQLELGQKRMEIVMYLDQMEGRAVGCDRHGRLLAETVLPDPGAPIRTGIHISNTGPSLALDEIEVREWDGITTHGSAQSLIVSRSGVMEGKIEGYDAESEVLRLSGAETEELPLSQLRRGSVTPAVIEQGSAAEEREEGQLEFLLVDRSRVLGHLMPSVDSEHIRVDCPVTDETLEVDIASVVGVIGRAVEGPTEYPEGRHCTLQLAGTELAGCLAKVEPTERSDVPAFAFHPAASSNASRLNGDAAGTIVYRMAAPEPAPRPLRTINRSRIFRRPTTARNTVVTPRIHIEIGDEPQLAFRTGDVVSGSVKGIDASGVHFSSPQTTTNFADHLQLKSVTLQSYERGVTIGEKKLKRLVTVPRLQQDFPPTHLLISTTGDYLRGRLQRLDDDLAVMEVGRESVSIPRAAIAKIVWLFERDWDTNDQVEDENRTSGQGDDKQFVGATDPADKDLPFLVHTLRSGDRGLTFEPSALTQDGRLIGRSSLLGDCEVPLGLVHRILFGKDVGERIRQYHDDPWSLSLATLPKVFQQSDSGDVPVNALDGNPAPTFTLQTLDGDEFDLAQTRGKVIVLDFWASWCGPCMQSMPRLESAVEEIGSPDVRLIAINLQESSTRARAAIERLGINPLVLRDQDGKVASAYGARAIPQTVVIDRDGTVAGVFVGGSKKTLDSAVECIRKQLGSPL